MEVFLEFTGISSKKKKPNLLIRHGSTATHHPLLPPLLAPQHPRLDQLKACAHPSPPATCAGRVPGQLLGCQALALLHCPILFFFF